MSTSAAPAIMTEAEYLAMERAASVKHELWNGEVFAMTGGTLAHAMISANGIAALSALLRERGCHVLSSDAKVHVPLTRGFVYPDISVVCADLETYDDTRDILLNPILVVEVLSEGTERFDRGEKFAGYRSVASLVDYVLVSQQSHLVEVFSREADGSWRLRTYDDERPAIDLPSVETTLELAELYRGVSIEADAPA